MIRLLAFALLCLGSLRTPAAGQERFVLEPGESVVVVGNTFAERMAMSGYLEALIHAAHPEHRITVRQVPWSGDEAGLQPRELNVPASEAYLREHEAGVIIACFGMSESFAGAAGLEDFRRDLEALLSGWAAARYDGEAPRVILVSPIAQEDLGWPLPTGAEVARRNADIAAYTEAMRDEAGAHGAAFIDLSTPGAALAQRHGRLTTDGIHPGELGCWAYAGEMGRQLGWVAAAPGEGAADLVESLRRRAWDKHYHFRQLYRPTNTEYIWGRRAEPFGVVNFPAEHAQLRRMIDARQRDLWAMAKPTPEQLFAEPPAGPPIWERVPDSSAFPEDAWEPPEVAAQGTETSLGSIEIAMPDEFLKSFTVAPGYVVECFASEQDFPELANPLAFAFDEQHRLWVLCSPTYPHLLPGEQPRDRLIVLTDTNADGRADECRLFADEFAGVTGFAIDTDGVYLAQAPDLLKLVDTDGDGAADRREVVLSGFSMPDSHHQISALEWSPDGGFLLHEGTFGSTNVETPFGTRRDHDATIWHYQPRTGRLEAASRCEFPNPWGHAFDDYGASIMDSTSGGEHFAMSHISTAADYPSKPRAPGAILNRGRPTAGNEILSSRHFPEDAQGSHLTTQCIGFHGVRWDRLAPAGSSWASEPMPQDLLESSDTNFRPIDVLIGPDGAAYIADWCNPLIGHMQYSVRDPRRDHDHGRIWRVRHAERPLVQPPRIAGATTRELLGLLRLPERNTRHHARRLLQSGDPTEVLPELQSWLDGVAASDPLQDRLILEALWIRSGLGVADLGLASAALSLPTPEVRAGAVRLVRRWLQDEAVATAPVLALLGRAARDDDMRVRLESVVACGYATGPEAAAVALIAAEREMDDAMRLVLDETLKHLRKYGEPDSDYARRARLRAMPPAELASEPWSDLVARVALERADVQPDVRRRALETLGGNPAAVLSETVLASPTPAETALALAPLVVESVIPGAPADARLRAHQLAEVRALGTAWELAAGGAFGELLAHDAEAAVSGLAMIPDRMLDRDESLALQRAIEGSRVEPGGAVALLAERAADREAVAGWLAEKAGAAGGVGLDAWGPGHVLAMAALHALHDLHGERWPAEHAHLRVAIDREAVERGRAVYHDEAIGCVRCHGARGEGLPGFPPLVGSPWALGSGARAAAIVIHGLGGELSLPDGRVFRSAMAPLGAVLGDQQVSDVLTYVRTSWGNFAPPVSLETVRSARTGQANGGRLLDPGALLAAFPFSEDRLVPEEPTRAQKPGAFGRMRLIAGVGLGAVAVGGLVALLRRKGP
ncbi:MAG TPA: PVC-type heme-binding CxxCH protein [Phycisphaerales bacterium]|nr:PVC-type heme-binding CxxCH protein [Phycisphaerales bacterium]